MNTKKINLKTILIIIIIIVAIGSSFYFYNIGLERGKNLKQAEADKYKTILDAIFLPLPDEVFQISGEIKAVENKTLSIEIDSLAERYPSPDRIPFKEIKNVLVTENTEIKKTDFSLLQPGEEIFPIETSWEELKIGDKVTVTSEENIKEKDEFLAKTIEIFVFPQ